MKNNVDESNKIFSHTTEIGGNFKNRHNNLKNTYQGLQTLYINKEGIPFYSEISIDEFILNSDSKVEFENLIKFKKVRKKILGKKAYEAFLNKETVEFNFNQLKRLNDFINKLKRDETKGINEFLFGKNNILDIKSTKNNKDKLLELLTKSNSNFRKKEETIRKFVEREEDLGNVEEITTSEWLDKFLTTYGKITSKEEEQTIRNSLKNKNVDKDFEKKLTKFLKKYSEKLIEFTLEVEKHKQLYRKNFDEAFPIKDLNGIHNFFYSEGDFYFFQRAHIKSQKSIVDEAFELLINGKDWETRLKQISNPNNLLPIRHDMHAAYDQHLFHFSENGNLKRGPLPTSEEQWEDILSWAEKRNFLKLPEYYINNKNQKIPYLKNKRQFIVENKRIMLKNKKVREQVIEDAKDQKVNIFDKNGNKKNINEIFYLLEREHLLKKLDVLGVPFKRVGDSITIDKSIKSNQELERLINRSELTSDLKSLNMNTIVTDDNYQDVKYLVEKRKTEKENSFLIEKAEYHNIDHKGLTKREVIQKVKEAEDNEWKIKLQQKKKRKKGISR